MLDRCPMFYVCKGTISQEKPQGSSKQKEQELWFQFQLKLIKTRGTSRVEMGKGRRTMSKGTRLL